MDRASRKKKTYQKQRRNRYGENAKSSRKNISRSKRIVNRVNRRVASTVLKQADTLYQEDNLDLLETTIKRKKTKRWRKYPDVPLYEVVVTKIERRVKLGIISEAKAKELIQRIETRMKPSKEKPRLDKSRL